MIPRHAHHLAPQCDVQFLPRRGNAEGFAPACDAHCVRQPTQEQAHACRIVSTCQVGGHKREAVSKGICLELGYGEGITAQPESGLGQVQK